MLFKFTISRNSSKIYSLCFFALNCDKYKVKVPVYTMKTLGLEVWLHSFLILSVSGGEWSGMCPDHFTPWESVYSNHWIGCWMAAQPVWMIWRRD